MFKVIVSDSTFENHEPEAAALAGLAEVSVIKDFPGRAAFLELARDADAVLSQMSPLDRDTVRGLTKCRLIVRYGVGVDNVDVAAATECGIAVCNVPDYCTEEVADHTLMLALALLRKLPESIALIRGGDWGHAPLRPYHRVSALTIGLYGFGRIARAVARRAVAFGGPVIAYDPYVPPETFAANGVERVTVEELLARADLLALHMPLTPHTHHLVNAASLAKMKRGVLLVNTSRGALVDTAALLDALDTGQVGGVALDVLEQEPIPADHPLWERPRVVLTGHMAWYSEEALADLQRLVGEECARVLRGEPPRNCVNPNYVQARRSNGK